MPWGFSDCKSAKSFSGKLCVFTVAIRKSEPCSCVACGGGYMRNRNRIVRRVALSALCLLGWGGGASAEIVTVVSPGGPLPSVVAADTHADRDAAAGAVPAAAPA